MKSFVYAFLLLFISSVSFAQNMEETQLSFGKLSIGYPDSTEASFFLDGIAFENSGGNAAVRDSVSTGNHQLEILIEGDSTMVVSTSILISPQLTLQLELIQENNSYTLVSKGLQSDEESANSESVASSSVRALSTELLISTNSSCARPTSQVTINQTLEILKSKSFQRERLKYLERFFPGECITVNQLRQLLSLIDDEDHRLNMLIQAEDHLFDLNNLHEIREDFILSRSIERFDQWEMMMK
jgi:hypothetical protein